MEMEKKNLAIIILAIVLAASGVGNIILGMQLGIIEVVAPPRGQNLVFGTVQGNIVDLDPHYSYDTASNDVIDNVVEQLYQFNISVYEDNRIVPWLATDFPTISANGTEYIINLRQGILFHDNYTFNATAVKWSLDRLCYFMNYSDNADLPAPFNVSLPDHILPTQLGILYEQADGKRVINKTEVLSEYQVKITLNAPKGSFMPVLAYTGSGAVSPWSTPPLDYHQLSDTLIGTGPFRYVGFIADVEVRLEGNPDYWGTPDNTGPTQLETVTYAIVPDITTLMNGLLAGDVDIIDSVDPPFIDQFQADPDISCELYGNSLTIAWTTFNYDHINLTMRKALSYCYNYTYAVDVIYSGVALRLQSPIPQGIPYSNYSLDYPTQDIAAARNFLLTDPQWGPRCTDRGLSAASTDNDWITVATGNPLASYNVSYNIGNPYREGFGNRLSFDAEFIGVAVSVHGYVWADYLDMIVSQRQLLDMYSLGWAPDYLDPENYINPMYDVDASTNGGNFYEPDVQALMDDGLSETDPVARKTIYDEIQRLLIEEYYPAMWQVSGVNYDAWQTYVHGWQPNPIARTWFYECYID